jgi:hypothetical protein
MAWFRRLALIVSIVLSCSLALAANSMAAGPGPGGPPSAGKYHTTMLHAGYTLASKTPGVPYISIGVTRTTQESKPLGSPSTTTSQTNLTFDFFSDTLNVSGCFILAAPSDFTINGAQTATLNTTFDSTTPTCMPPYLVPPAPITLNVTWSGASATATAHDNRVFKCLSYSSVTEMTDVSSNNTATATLTSPVLSGSFPTTTAGLDSNDQLTEVEGILNPTCPAGIGGKGAGPGPQPAGTYHNTNQLAAFASSSGSFGIFVNRGTRVSHPVGGPSTTTTETQVQVQEPNGYSCFILTNSQDLSQSGEHSGQGGEEFSQSGVQSASLQTTFDLSTPTCFSYGPPVSLPLTVAVTWAAAGPLVTGRGNSSYSCLAFSTQATGLDTGKDATGTATLTSPSLSGTFSASFGNLSTSDVRIHSTGVDTDPCMFRN